MTDRMFAVASDEALIELIEGARTRLVVIAPALTRPVAEALSRRFHDLERLNVTVILDSDPEVYRLGFGEPDALETIRHASTQAMFDLREQPGIRIGVVIADDTTMIFTPISKTVEAGSTSVEKPNAIVLKGAADGIASAAGAVVGDKDVTPEVGAKALEPARVEAMQSDLKANPPKPFDITRKLNVFRSKVQYVEFSATNYRLTSRQIPMPPEFVAVDDEDLKKQINSRIRAPFDDIGKLTVEIETGGDIEKIKVDDDWLKKERKRIEDEYTFQINNFGRVILSTDAKDFKTAADRFRVIVEKYQEALCAELLAKNDEFTSKIVNEFADKWEERPPIHFKRYKTKPTREAIVKELSSFADEIFKTAITFEPPRVKVLYKNVAFENLQEPEFLASLRGIMLKRRVPRSIVDSLFETGQAAPESGSFLNR